MGVRMQAHTNLKLKGIDSDIIWFSFFTLLRDQTLRQVQNHKVTAHWNDWNSKCFWDSQRKNHPVLAWTALTKIP